MDSRRGRSRSMVFVPCSWRLGQFFFVGLDMYTLLSTPSNASSSRSGGNNDDDNIGQQQMDTTDHFTPAVHALRIVNCVDYICLPCLLIHCICSLCLFPSLLSVAACLCILARLLVSIITISRKI